MKDANLENRAHSDKTNENESFARIASDLWTNDVEQRAKVSLLPNNMLPQAFAPNEALLPSNERLEVPAQGADSPTINDLPKFNELLTLSPDFASWKAAFEKRCQGTKISQAEIKATYKEIERLLAGEGKSVLAKEQLVHLAEEVMHQAADPTAVEQGGHNTCNTATVEARMYYKKPWESARLVADVALTGQYKAGNGTTVEIDSHPHDSSKHYPLQDGERSHASEIFQVTSVNIALAERARIASLDSYRYIQGEPALDTRWDTGERIQYFNKQDSKWHDASSGKRDPHTGEFMPLFAPDLEGNDIAKLETELTGKPQLDYFLAYDQNRHPEDGHQAIIQTEVDLEKMFEHAKEMDNLPLILQVNVGNEPFYTDAQGDTPRGGRAGNTWHVVLGTSYQDGKVEVENEWENEANHFGKRALTVKELFRAMRSPEKNIPSLQQEVEAARLAGKCDPAKEREFLRLQRNFGQVSEEKFDELLKTSMQAFFKGWEHYSKEEKVTITKSWEQLKRELPSEDVVTMLVAQYNSHQIFKTDQNFDTSAALFIAPLDFEKQQAKSLDELKAFSDKIAHIVAKIRKADLPKERKDEWFTSFKAYGIEVSPE